MHKNTVLFFVVLSSLFFAGCTAGGELFRQSVEKTAPKSNEIGVSIAPVSSEFIDPYGSVITTTDGYALYTFANDSKDTSNCIDECALVWPPFIINYPEEVSGLYGFIERADGSLQVTLDGMPVYTYAPDRPHSVTGDGIDGVWSVVLGE